MQSYWFPVVSVVGDLFLCLFNTEAYCLALPEAYENGFILKPFSLGTYNEKSLYKLQVFSWDNANLLFLFSTANDYTGNTEKNLKLIYWFCFNKTGKIQWIITKSFKVWSNISTFLVFWDQCLIFSYIYFIILNSYFSSASLPFLAVREHDVQRLTETSSVKTRNLHKVKSMFLHFYKKCIKPRGIAFYKNAE